MDFTVKDKLQRTWTLFLLLLLAHSTVARRQQQDPREAMEQIQMVMNMIQAAQNQERAENAASAVNEVSPYSYASPYYSNAQPSMYGDNQYFVPAYPVYDYYEEQPEQQTKRPARSRSREKQRTSRNNDENEPLSFRNVFTTFVRNLGWAFTSESKK